MTAVAGELLIREIMPLIAATIMRGGVRPVGSEDRDELASQGCAMAAAMLDSAETRGKACTAGTIAYFVLLGLKSGRRFGSAGRYDAMSPAAALDSAVQLQSMDSLHGRAADDDDETGWSLHDILASTGDDVDEQVARRLDWDQIEAGLDPRCGRVVRETAIGYGPKEIAAGLDVSPPYVIQLRRKCAAAIDEAWGQQEWLEALKPSQWRTGLRAAAEKRACRAARR